MDAHQAKNILAAFRADAAAVDREIAALLKKRAALQKLIAGYLELFPDLTAEDEAATEIVHGSDSGTPETPRPRSTRQAIHTVLSSRPGGWFTIRQIKEGLEQQGWQTSSSNPMNVLRNTLQQIVQQDRTIERRQGQGQLVEYRKVLNPTTNGAAQHGATLMDA